ncbi:RagB/SusD family nutrient uptake outer membrane protein [Parapedobacter deserti]|uniref:RagB/SusD family nutrient uptake outer membrane protein n=1 Tax=Parapedobacter deserti TaxID=1912957 RepID=A0ABV7JRN4_9SPHI
MKMRSIKQSILGLAAAMLASCNALDLGPTDTIDPSRAFRNVNDLNMGLLGAYAVLDFTLIGVTSVVSDEAVMPEENTVSNSDAYRWLYTSSSGSVTSAFAEYYMAIDRANRVLAAMDQVSAANAAEEQLKARYRGELLALRAYAHFELLRAYASAYEPGALGVPYMKESAIGSPTRAPFEAVVANLYGDLATAKSLIPSDFTDRTRITSAAVSAMQARVALYARDWELAHQYASEAIERAPLADRSDFADIWVDQSQAEVIWKLSRVVGDSRIGGFYFREAGGIALYAPSQKLMATYDRNNDIRFSAYVSHQPGRGAGKSEYLVEKYRGGDPDAPGLTDIKLFRTGELYLIKAEALAEDNQISAANEALNTLRSQRIAGYADRHYGGKDDLIQAVYEERYKELAFEGHRFFDLRRRRLPVERSPLDAANTSGALTLTPNQAQYALPIPTDELRVNPNMEQNPNY